MDLTYDMAAGHRPTSLLTICLTYRYPLLVYKYDDKQYMPVRTMAGNIAVLMKIGKKKILLRYLYIECAGHADHGQDQNRTYS